MNPPSPRVPLPTRSPRRPFVVLGSALCIVLLLLAASPAQATVGMAERTGQGCVVCHPDDIRVPGPAGLYYQENGTLDGWMEGDFEEPFHFEEGSCTDCHDETWEVDPTPRKLEDPHDDKDLKHGKGAFWCLTCHSPDHRNVLRLFNGEEIPWGEAPRLCGQCHGPIYRDWQNRLHGRWVGTLSDPKPARICTGCHNPHDPKFKPVPLEPADDYPAAPPKSPDLPFVVALGVFAFVGLAAYAAFGRRD
ncbi:MAG: cytochrome c3 family protein [Nitrospirota bacterium]|jgi:hypothetical protein